MPALRTNRDLYLAIEGLVQRYSGSGRSLEEYLRAMLAESDRYRNSEELSLDRFHALLEASFITPPDDFNEKWRIQYGRLPCGAGGFLGWRAILIQQIVDLREMQEDGTLANEHRFFGVRSPRNSYWYNFDPHGYLECAMAGSFGGWEPGDETGRNFVPGLVAVLSDDGKIETADPAELPRPIFNVPVITWEKFAEFLRCGQMYE